MQPVGGSRPVPFNTRCHFTWEWNFQILYLRFFSGITVLIFVMEVLKNLEIIFVQQDLGIAG